jgi:RimJ/RimL family protein N-acetyltransferase
MRNLLEGERVKLTAIKDSDFNKIQNWFNDVYFLRNYDMVAAIPKGNKETREALDYYLNSNEAYIFAIRSRESDEIIGVAGFDEIIWTNGTATVFIGIGSSELRGKGIGKEALSLLLDFGFFELNFHKVQLDVISYNESAVRLYEGAGFVQEGTYREFIYRDGERYDMYLYGLLKNEWKMSKHL